MAIWGHVKKAYIHAEPRLIGLQLHADVSLCLIYDPELYSLIERLFCSIGLMVDCRENTRSLLTIICSVSFTLMRYGHLNDDYEVREKP